MNRQGLPMSDETWAAFEEWATQFCRREAANLGIEDFSAELDQESEYGWGELFDVWHAGFCAGARAYAEEQLKFANTYGGGPATSSGGR